MREVNDLPTMQRQSVTKSSPQPVATGGMNRTYAATATRGPAISNQAMQQIMRAATEPPGDLGCPIAEDTPAPVVTDVFFSLGKDGVDPTEQPKIKTFIEDWQYDGTDRPVRVDGYASVDGDPTVNWRLSCDRAVSVFTELVHPASGAPGIPERFIDAFAQGPTSEFPGGLEANRRVTISADIHDSPAPICQEPGQARILPLQPVFLRTELADPEPTGKSWDRRFRIANEIWGKIGVTFLELPPVTLNTDLKTAGTTVMERFLVGGLKYGPGIEIFLVDNDMTWAGGGSTVPFHGNGCGPAGNIVLSDRGASNTLLAHELGHILGLDHPRVGINPGEPGTIMDASGSNENDSPTRNTLVNYALITCPEPAGLTCLEPDE